MAIPRPTCEVIADTGTGAAVRKSARVSPGANPLSIVSTSGSRRHDLSMVPYITTGNVCGTVFAGGWLNEITLNGSNKCYPAFRDVKQEDEHVDSSLCDHHFKRKVFVIGT